MEKRYDAIIVGGGPAGLSAAIYMARARFHVLVIEKEKMGGQITITSEVVNYPGVYKTDGEALTREMVRQAEAFGAEFLTAEVKSLSLTADTKVVHTDRGDFEAMGIIYAAGAHPRLAGFPAKKNSVGMVWLTVRHVMGSSSPERTSLLLAVGMQPWRKPFSSLSTGAKSMSLFAEMTFRSRLQLSMS